MKVCCEASQLMELSHFPWSGATSQGTLGGGSPPVNSEFNNRYGTLAQTKKGSLSTFVSITSLA